MKRSELLPLHEQLCQDARDLMKAKNQDYASDDSDPFSNLTACQTLGVDPVIGVLIRIGDKFARIKSFIEKGELQVKDESVRDSILDSINYLVLAAGMIQDRSLSPEKEEPEFSEHTLLSGEPFLGDVWSGVGTPHWVGPSIIPNVDVRFIHDEATRILEVLKLRAETDKLVKQYGLDVIKEALEKHHGSSNG